MVNANMNDEYEQKILQFYNETKEFESRIGIIIPMIFTIIIILGLFGNLLVVIVAFNRKMRNSTNILIIGLLLSIIFFS